MKGKTKLTALLLLGTLASTAIGIGIFCWANFARAADGDGNLIITEIMYNQAEDIDDKKTQWVEMTAKKDVVFELKTDGQIKNFYLCARKKKESGSCASFYAVYSPEGIKNITAGAYVIFTTNPETLRNVYDLSNDIVILKTSSSFSLLDKDSSTNYPFISYSQDNKVTLHEEILYGDFFNKKEPGHSLERIDFDKENTKNNWQESYVPGGTPGRSNSTAPEDTEDSEEPEEIELKCSSFSDTVKFNELFPYPETGDQEFVELKNFSEDCVDLSGWRIVDEKENKYVFASGTIIEPGKFWHASRNFYMNNTSTEVMHFFDSSGKEVDKVSYTKALKNFSFSLDGENWRWTSTPTPGYENVITTPGSETGESETGVNYYTAENVYLNEILPNPKGGSDDEYIEIASGESEPVDLFGWRIKDGSKSKGYQFKEHIILNSGEYFAIYRPDSKIALNNSDESVNLYNPQGEVVSSAAFDKSPKNASFNFNGENWKWSKYLTPGKKNKFDSEPLVKIKKPKSVFKDIFAEFSAKAKDKETKKLKYAWDFGDGKKSYLAKTSHKYLATGKYAVMLSVTDDSQTIKKSFTINVKKYPRPDLEIVKAVPNPAGSDTDGEIVEIRNNSGKKIDLKGWKIATGSNDKLYNHPISGEISLGSNETKAITRELSKFSLNNKVGKVRLISPDGKVIDEVEYQKEKIADDEAYVKIDDKWQWIAPNALAETDDLEETGGSEDTQNEELEEQPNGEILGATDENAPYHAPPQTRYTSEDEFIFLKLFGLLDYKPKEMNFCPVNQSSIITIAYLLLPS